jgi:hypothetical protein
VQHQNRASAFQLNHIYQSITVASAEYLTHTELASRAVDAVDACQMLDLRIGAAITRFENPDAASTTLLPKRVQTGRLIRPM